MAAPVSLEFGFVARESWNSWLSCPAKPVLVLVHLPLAKTLSISRDRCWKWDCVKCDGLDVEEADMNHRFKHPLLIVIMPFGPLFPSSGDTLPIIWGHHCHLRLRCQFWSERSGSCAWCSPPYPDHPTRAGEGSSSLLLWVCICSPGFRAAGSLGGCPGKVEVCPGYIG